MADLPSKFPEWTSNPPAGPPSSVEPTQAQKESGWQPPGSVTFPDGKPVLQFSNWLFNLIWQWVVWLAQVTWRSSDSHEDQALPGGTAPSLGAGLSGPAADFSARIYVGGYAVGPIESPAHSYSPSVDTYWDLTRAGTWVAQPVANGNPEPALTPLAVRVYVVVTNATDRVSVEDRRKPRIETTVLQDFRENVRFGWNKLGTAVDAALARISTPYNSAQVFTLIQEVAEASSNSPGVRIYAQTNGVLLVVRGAWFDGTNWNVDVTPAFFSLQMLELGTDRTIVRRLPGTHPSPFPSLDWFAAESAAAAVEHILDLDGRLELAGAVGGTGYSQTRLPKIRTAGSGAIASRVYHHEMDYLGIYGLLSNAEGTEGAQRGGELVSNATYNEDTGQWNQIAAGTNSYKLEISDAGFRFLVHLDVHGPAWGDTVSAGNWAFLAQLSDQFVQTVRVPASSAVQSSVPSGGSPNIVTQSQWSFAALGAIPGGASGLRNVNENDSAIAIDLCGVLPDRSIITGSRVRTTTDGSSAGANEIRVSVLKIVDLAGVSLRQSAPGYEVVTPHGSGSPVLFTLDLDAPEITRTVDLSVASYMFVLQAMGGSLPAVSWIEITFEKRSIP